jgi:outer membrane biosynthesis protein TonB
VWLLEVGAGSDADRKVRPALLLVAGIEGNDLVGTVSVVHWVEQLLQRYAKDDSMIRSLLDKTTIYVFPRVNPDAAEHFFSKPRQERTTNDTPVDDDHDGLVDEDGPEDLNGDGLITSMRVEDPEGEYILDPAEPRLLIKADQAKGERGAWKLFSEGIDNDQDGQWNEDGAGGVNLNRNFPYHYEYFAPWAGWHQVSEVETRALADFVVAHPNIGIAFTFGAADNLVQTPKSEPPGKRPPTAITESDAPFYRELARIYRDTIGLKKELTAVSEPGTLSDWIYFDRGRLSLAARPWTPQLQLETEKKPADKKAEEPKPKAEQPPASEKKEDQSRNENEERERGTKKNAPQEEKKEGRDKPEADKRGEEERAELKWFDQNAPEAFVAWKSFQHPDFPKQKVEIGGWSPFARSNPPAKFLEDLCQRQAKFFTELAGKLPRIAFRKAEAKHLGHGVYELTIELENNGYLPTVLVHGAATREVLRTRVVLNLQASDILAGEKMTFLGPIGGSGGMEQLRYVVRAKAPVEVQAISALGGTVRRTINLSEAQ